MLDEYEFSPRDDPKGVKNLFKKFKDTLWDPDRFVAQTARTFFPKIPPGQKEWRP